MTFWVMDLVLEVFWSKIQFNYDVINVRISFAPT